MKPKFTDAERFKHAEYAPSHATDIRKRFARIKQARAAAEREAEANAAEAAVKVEQLQKRKRA